MKIIMNKHSLSLCIFLFIAIFLTGCCCGGPDRSLVTESFPLHAGSMWKYKVTDSLNSTVDTVVVNIIENKTIRNHDVSVWQYLYKKTGKGDTLYVFKTYDTIKFYSNVTLAVLIKQYVIPFTINKVWNSTEFKNGDTTTVVSQTDVIVGEKKLSSYQLSRQWESPNYHLKENTWVSDKVGVVQMTIKEFNLEPTKNEYWQLIDYSITQVWNYY